MILYFTGTGNSKFAADYLADKLEDTTVSINKCLKNGEKVVLYPEETRNKTDAEILPFKHGASVMAIRTKTPIIPIMLYNKPRFFRMTHVLIGDPVELTEYYDRKL